jgi:two-component system, NtrC family, sensor histidine kinase HydH
VDLQVLLYYPLIVAETESGVYFLPINLRIKSMLSLQPRFNVGLRTSPWLILGAAAILMIAVVVLAFQNIRRDQRHMKEVLSTKGVAVIRAVEAGARTGMMGMRWGGAQVQRLLEETGRLPEVLYIAILSQDGHALAHSDPSRVGYPLHAERRPVHTGPDFEEAKELIALADGRRVFEIHREFKPVRQGGRFREHGMWPGMRRPDNEREWLEHQEGDRLIVVGLDVAPLKTGSPPTFAIPFCSHWCCCCWVLPASSPFSG